MSVPWVTLASLNKPESSFAHYSKQSLGNQAQEQFERVWAGMSLLNLEPLLESKRTDEAGNRTQEPIK
jgi:hypothetical protein